MTNHDLMRISAITKTYPGVVANKNISLNIKSGEIHALLGENGSGKSTLVKIIYGLIKSDSGTMHFENKLYAPNQPSAARSHGVTMVFQHFSLFDALSVAENIALGMDKPPSIKNLSNTIESVSKEYGLPIDPRKSVGDLSAGEQQRVEIIRCLLQDPKLLIMDEPTSVLTPNEANTLFITLDKLKLKGTSILYISHKLEEIRLICDTATILRGGENVGTCNPQQESAKTMAEMMIGSILRVPKKKSSTTSEIALEVRALNRAPETLFGTYLKNLSFTVNKGEILGVGGVSGNGQDELTNVLSGESLSEKNSIKLFGKPIGNLPINNRRLLGMLTAPEERLGHAAVPDMTLIENAFLTGKTREGLLNSNDFINWNKTKEFADGIIDKFDVRTPGPHATARALSGGNLQKFVIGRELIQKPLVLVVNQPTWGVDAAAAASIRQALLDLATLGAAIIVISQDLDELIEIADSLVTINAGNLSKPRLTKGLSVEDISLMMAGTGDQWSQEINV